MNYFDHNATTPVAGPVLEAMLPFLREQYGNASSRHELGTMGGAGISNQRTSRDAKDARDATAGKSPTSPRRRLGANSVGALATPDARAGTRSPRILNAR